jgi:catechol 2,3-dioxygenase-like lactoylglutathione lyase family enzyme
VPGAAAPRGIYETVLYGDDVDALVAFYTHVVGLRAIEPPDAFSAAFRMDDGGLLLIFDPARSSVPGRFVPSHGAAGEGHIAFRVEPGGLAAVMRRLRTTGLEIEREITWPRGGSSIYIRDPAGNSVEFVEGEIWGP